MTNKQIIYFMTFVWLMSILWSLYFSTYWDPVLNIMQWHLFSWEAFVPCDLCRRERIVSYPIFILWLCAIFYKDERVARYILPFSLIGLALTIYHVCIQSFQIANTWFCSPSNPCSVIDVTYMWFLTIPMMALISFVILVICSMISISKSNSKNN